VLVEGYSSFKRVAIMHVGLLLFDNVVVHRLYYTYYYLHKNIKRVQLLKHPITQ
jgi:hypothetical protein